MQFNVQYDRCSVVIKIAQLTLIWLWTSHVDTKQLNLCLNVVCVHQGCFEFWVSNCGISLSPFWLWICLCFVCWSIDCIEVWNCFMGTLEVRGVVRAFLLTSYGPQRFVLFCQRPERIAEYIHSVRLHSGFARSKHVSQFWPMLCAVVR